MFELGELQSAEGWQRVGQDCNSPQEETWLTTISRK
jgi:hypothetical protein